MPITDPHPEHLAASPLWARMRDCAAGEDAVKARRQEYLPRPGGQSERAYRAYLARAVWYGATERTLNGLAGAIFRHPPVVEAPDTLARQLDSIAADGGPFEGLAQSVTREALLTGRAGLLADRAADANGDPYLALYPAEWILNWESAPLHGRQRLTRLVLREDMEHCRELLLDATGQYRVRLWRRKSRQAGASSLSILAETVGRGLTHALRRLAWWQGLEPNKEGDSVIVRLNRDFVEARLAAPDILALVESWQKGAISRRTLYDNLRAGEVLPPGRDFAEEESLIAAESA